MRRASSPNGWAIQGRPDFTCIVARATRADAEDQQTELRCRLKVNDEPEPRSQPHDLIPRLHPRGRLASEA
jgi:hypothetical protein